MAEYRDFLNKETQSHYIGQRNQYLFRQGDAVEGIYLILTG